MIWDLLTAVLAIVQSLHKPQGLILAAFNINKILQIQFCKPHFIRTRIIIRLSDIIITDMIVHWHVYQRV